MEKRELVKKLNIIDDTLFHKMIEDRAVCEEMLQTFLEDENIQIISNNPQMFLRNAGARSVILDVLCKDSLGRYFNVEVQKADQDNHQKRVRYHGSNIDTYVTEKGIAYDEIPDVYVIYISRFDMFKSNCTVYHVDRIIRETGEVVENGFYEVYLNAGNNAGNNDGSKTAELLQYMTATNGGNAKFPNISKRVKYFKEEEEGIEIMCDIVEAYAQERAKKAAKEVARETARKFFESGVSYEIVEKSIDLPSEELKQIYEEVMGVLC